MKIKAILSIKNDKLLSARKELNLTQKELAYACSVSVDIVSRLERLDLKGINPASESVRNVANFFSLDIEDIAPQALCGVKFSNKFEQVAEIDSHALLLYANDRQTQQILPSPAEVYEHVELTDYFINLLKDNIELLSKREKEVLTQRFGLDGKEPKTLAEVGKSLNVTCSRVRQCEAFALHKCRHIIDKATRLKDTKEYI